MARVESEFVVRFEDVFIHPFSTDGVQMYNLCIVMENCAKGDLQQFICNNEKKRTSSDLSSLSSLSSTTSNETKDEETTNSSSESLKVTEFDDNISLSKDVPLMFSDNEM